MKHILFTLSFLLLLSCDDNITNTADTNVTVKKETIKLNDRLKKELASISKTFNSSAYRGSVESIQMEIVLFSLWASLVKESELSADKEDKKMGADIKKKLISLQKKEFPKMRKAYSEIIAQKLWVNDTYVNASGSSNTIINFSGAVFATNKNIQETQNSLFTVLSEFRFKETRYRWYKGADEFTYYKLESPKDDELYILK